MARLTSERAQVVAVDHHAVTLLGSDLDPDRIAHGDALNVHREQGATSDRTHYYADGGGRELAYVATSRARHHHPHRRRQPRPSHRTPP